MNIHLQIKPGSRLDRIEVIDGVFHIKIKACPIDGEANAYLVKYLAAFFDVSGSSVEIIKGHTSKYKTVSIEINSLEFEKKLAKLG